jgi:hypothetical protein
MKDFSFLISTSIRIEYKVRLNTCIILLYFYKSVQRDISLTYSLVPVLIIMILSDKNLGHDSTYILVLVVLCNYSHSYSLIDFFFCLSLFSLSLSLPFSVCLLLFVCSICDTISVDRI